MYEIEKNVPVPRMSGPRSAPVFPFDKMEIGDSFKIPIKSWEKPRIVQNRLSAAAARWRALPGNADFLIKTRKDGNAVRCWRVK